jgi:electron transfer flavoprotein alpha subunit
MTVLVAVEHDGGALRKVSAQVLTAARGVADEVHAVAWGPGAAGVAADVERFGGSRVHVCDDDVVAGFATGPQVAVLAAAVDASGADTVLYPADPFLTDVVATVAVARDGGVITDAVDLHAGDDGLVATKAIFGGDMVSRCRVKPGRLACIGVKANAFATEEVDGGPPAEVSALDVVFDESARRVHVVDTVEQTSGDRPEMTEASVIAAGGRGLGDAEGFRLIEALADALGGAVGASRAATDAGWYPHQHQIGQTGKTVAPQLYIGSGISGAIQHRAGMQTSQLIAAINSDRDAPIFSIADFGVVGDLHKVIPALIDEIEQRGS